MGQQDLGGVQAVEGKNAFVGLGEAHLADGGCRLELVHLLRAAGQPRRCMPAAMAPRIRGPPRGLRRAGRRSGGPSRQASTASAFAVVGDQGQPTLTTRRRALRIAVLIVVFSSSVVNLFRQRHRSDVVAARLRGSRVSRRFGRRLGGAWAAASLRQDAWMRRRPPGNPGG